MTLLSHLKFYNTLERTLMPFQPLDPQCVSLYVCGPTVYSRIHLGNARSLVVFDVLYRLLSFFFPKVIYIRNITDVDDKINEAAGQLGISITALTEGTIQQFHKDIAVLGIWPPTVEPKATEHIPQMLSMIQSLLHRGLAYAQDGHVLFRTKAFPGYGRLSSMPLDEMQAGARVEVAPYKEDPCDFVLWKPALSEDVGWDSPWGWGRPGWHIECSAMSTTYLGDTFDIHGGGQDLLFPHHENEHSQTCGVTGGHESARYWLHNGMLVVDGKKMSKSLGNFITLREALDTIHPEIIRWALLSSHYRQTLDWTPRLVEQSKTCLTQLYQIFRDLEGSAEEEDRGGEDALLQDWHLAPSFLEALCDDMNTPKALGVLQKLGQDINKSAGEEKRRLIGVLRNSAQFLGFLQESPESWFQTTGSQLSPEDIAAYIAERTRARLAGDYGAADAVRTDLLRKGIVLEDHPDGRTSWRTV